MSSKSIAVALVLALSSAFSPIFSLALCTAPFLTSSGPATSSSPATSSGPATPFSFATPSDSVVFAQSHGVSAQPNEQAQSRGGPGSPGQLNFYYDPGPKIIINVPACRLYFYRDNCLVKDYPIAVGKVVSKTILGEYTVVRKAKNPTWYPPDGSPPVPPGPANPVGSRWLGLSKDSYGIHGTNNPSSIGKAVSLGCIRMLEKDVQELYDMAPVGTRVKFIYETVVVTTDPVLGQVYVTVFPDIYKQGTNSVSHAMAAIFKSPGAAGLEPDEFILSNILNEAKGKPVIFPRRVEIVVGGKALTRNGFVQVGEPMLPLADLMLAAGTMGAPAGYPAKAGGAAGIAAGGGTDAAGGGAVSSATASAASGTTSGAAVGAVAPGATKIYGRVYVPLSGCPQLPGFGGAKIRIEYRGLTPVVYIDLPGPGPGGPPPIEDAKGPAPVPEAPPAPGVPSAGGSASVQGAPPAKDPTPTPGSPSVNESVHIQGTPPADGPASIQGAPSVVGPALTQGAPSLGDPQSDEDVQNSGPHIESPT